MSWLKNWIIALVLDALRRDYERRIAEIKPLECKFETFTPSPVVLAEESIEKIREIVKQEVVEKKVKLCRKSTLR